MFPLLIWIQQRIFRYFILTSYINRRCRIVTISFVGGSSHMAVLLWATLCRGQFAPTVWGATGLGTPLLQRWTSPLALKPAVLQQSQSQSQSQSYITTDGQSVSQYVLLSSPIWDFWPETYFFFPESYSIVLFGAPSLTRGRVCHLSVFCHYSL
jgi:hypothetical protein